jgi:protein-S-isoprenylcysteine O-methyltransferase Ste14
MFWVPPFAVFCLFVARLIELSHKFPASSGRIEAPRTFQALTLVGSLAVIGALAEYFVARPSPSLGLIVGGLALAIFAFGLRASARRALGLMWSVHVEIREQHILVDTGPYRLVRHPIYVAAIAELAAVPLTLGAWRTGVVALVAYVIVLSRRVQAEERAMAVQLGERWNAYCARTGAFLPRW